MSANRDVWNELVQHLGKFDSAVLTWVEPSGFPFSIRCWPIVDTRKQVLLLDLPMNMPLISGPAGLLCHRHDERLFNQKSFLVRGAIEREDKGRSFVPYHFIPGAGIGGILGTIRFTSQAQRYTKQYLAARGLSRPTIPWGTLLKLKAEATKD